MNNDSTFNKPKFAELLERAKGDRSINRFAQDTGVSAAHISRFLRSKIDAPPSPETISKLSSSAYNNVDYRALMVAAGHIALNNQNDSDELDELQNDKDCSDKISFTQKIGRIDRYSPNEKYREMEIIESKIHQILFGYLYNIQLKWSMKKPESTRSEPDIVLDIENDVYKKWYFEIISIKNSRYLSPLMFSNIYGRLVLKKFQPDEKYTIVVNSKAAYDSLLKRPPLSLKANLYIMLVDTEKWIVIGEEKLCNYNHN